MIHGKCLDGFGIGDDDLVAIEWNDRIVKDEHRVTGLGHADLLKQLLEFTNLVEQLLPFLFSLFHGLS